MDFINIILFVISFLLVLISMNHFKLHGVRSYNILIFSVYFCLLLNTTKLSLFQQEKTFEDFYYFLVGPLLFCVPLYIAEHIKPIRLKSILHFNIDLIFLSLLVLYIALKLYISSIVGWRIESFAVSTYLNSGDQYTVPGVSGLAISTQWLLLILSPLVSRKRRLLVILFILAVIVFSILHVKRGDIMRMFIFYFIIYLYKNYNNIPQKSFSQNSKGSKNTLKIVALIFCIVLFFIVLGNFRQDARGDDENTTVANSGLVVDNQYLAWIYSYIAINYDVLKLYYKTKPGGKPTAIVSLYAGDENNVETKDINGFNASTFLRSFITDYAEFFFIELFVFSMILSFILYLSKSIQYNTLYLYMNSLFALFPFGNYFETRAMMVAIFLFVLLNMFLEKPKALNLIYKN